MTKKYSQNPITKRAYNLEFRADGEDGVIEGVPIVFDRDTTIHDYFGEYIERIDSHALDHTDMSDVCLFTNHDTGKIPLARSKNGKGTLKMIREEDGLHIKTTLDIENNPSAKELYSAIKRGDMDGMSFMFRVDSDEWSNLESDVPTRTIKSISVIHEVSVVNHPAYKDTSVSARSTEETDYSPLKEMRDKAKAEETAKYNESLEIAKIKALSKWW